MANEGGESTAVSTPKVPTSPQVYKARRSTTKRLFTRTVNSVERKINSKADRCTMELLRENIKELMN